MSSAAYDTQAISLFLSHASLSPERVGGPDAWRLKAEPLTTAVAEIYSKTPPSVVADILRAPVMDALETVYARGERAALLCAALGVDEVEFSEGGDSPESSSSESESSPSGDGRETTPWATIGAGGSSDVDGAVGSPQPPPLPPPSSGARTDDQDGCPAVRARGGIATVQGKDSSIPRGADGTVLGAVDSVISSLKYLIDGLAVLRAHLIADAFAQDRAAADGASAPIVDDASPGAASSFRRRRVNKGKKRAAPTSAARSPVKRARNEAAPAPAWGGNPRSVGV